MKKEKLQPTAQNTKNLKRPLLATNKRDNLEEMDRFLERYNLQDWTKEKQKIWAEELPVMKRNQQFKNAQQGEV